MPRSNYRHSVCVAVGILAAVLAAGCGTTRSTDTARTATEQLLISDAIDRSVQEIDFRPLAGQTVYLDAAMLKGVTDRNYLVSTLRQHLLASGCTIKDNRDEADFIVEARAGAVGTDRNDLLFGIPATNVPQILPLQGVPAAIPEVPLAKRRDQRGIAKISMFAYHRESGLPAWQSGLAVRESSSNDVWVFGAGPFEHGTIHKNLALALRRTAAAKANEGEKPTQSGRVHLSQQATFESPAKLAEQFHRMPQPTEVVQAAHTEPAVTASPDVQVSLPTSPAAQFSRVAAPMLPNLAEAMTHKDDVPKLTGRVDEQQVVRPALNRTVKSSPPTAAATPDEPVSDLIPLPQPRFDSL